MEAKDKDLAGAVREISDAVLEASYSPNEEDSNGEKANVVDGLFFIGRGLLRIAEAVDGLKNAILLPRKI